MVCSVKDEPQTWAAAAAAAAGAQVRRPELIACSQHAFRLSYTRRAGPAGGGSAKHWGRLP